MAVGSGQEAGVAMSASKRVFCVLFAVLMIVAGTTHFTMTATYAAIVPPYVPAPTLVVYVSGVLEILGGLGLLIPATRRAAAWGLVLLLVAVLPANINQALHNLQPPGLEMSQTMLWVRLPLQLVLIAWAWWMTRPDRRSA